MTKNIRFKVEDKEYNELVALKNGHEDATWHDVFVGRVKPLPKRWKKSTDEKKKR